MPESALLSLVELTATVASGPDRQETLDRALAIVARELQLSRVALFVRGDEEGTFAVRAARGMAPEAPRSLCHTRPLQELTALAAGDEAHDRHGLLLLCPVQRRDRPLALLGLGPRQPEREYADEERAFLRGVVACLGAAVGSGALREELRRLSLQRARDVVQLHDLLDVGRELTLSADETAVHERLATVVMGHFVVSRCAVYRLGGDGLALVHARGLSRGNEGGPFPSDPGRAAVQALDAPRTVAELPEGPLRSHLLKSRLALVVPLATGESTLGMLAVGERSSGTPFTEEDRAFAHALARLAVTALENLRLQAIREEKQQQDRELQVAREIQENLFPGRAPVVPGFELAALSRPCREVGGDLYDYIPLDGGRLALIVADVSGKGTPASLLMASVHASARALAGTAPPDQVVARLNRFLFASTQANRFVTCFYAELDPARHRLSYVNAGHVPPFQLASDGSLVRLSVGGPALGLFDEPVEGPFEARRATLGTGEVLAIVSDGVTEAMSSDGREFGDDRLLELLRQAQGRPATQVLQRLVSAIEAWRGDARPNDDLTALVLRAL